MTASRYHSESPAITVLEASGATEMAESASRDSVFTDARTSFRASLTIGASTPRGGPDAGSSRPATLF